MKKRDLDHLNEAKRHFSFKKAEKVLFFAMHNPLQARTAVLHVRTLRMLRLLKGHNVPLDGDYSDLGETPLMSAARRGAVRIMEAMLSTGVDPSTAVEGHGALWSAVKDKRFNPRTVQLLLEEGCDPGADAAFVAKHIVQSRIMLLVEMLFSSAWIARVPRSQLLEDSVCSTLSVFQFVEQHADVLSPLASEAEAPLLSAIKRKRTDIALHLIEQEREVPEMLDGEVLWLLALRTEQVAILDMLMQRGAQLSCACMPWELDFSAQRSARMLFCVGVHRFPGLTCVDARLRELAGTVDTLQKHAALAVARQLLRAPNVRFSRIRFDSANLACPYTSMHHKRLVQHAANFLLTNTWA